MTYRIHWSKQLYGSFYTAPIHVPHRCKTTWGPWVIHIFTAKSWAEFVETNVFTSSYHCSHPSRPNSLTRMLLVVMQFPSMYWICEPNQHCLNTVWWIYSRKTIPALFLSTRQQRQRLCFLPLELVLINNLHFSM